MVHQHQARRPFSGTSYHSRRSSALAAQGNVLDSLRKAFGMGGTAYRDDGQQEDYQIDTGVFFVDNAPSWDELAQLVAKRMQETGYQDVDADAEDGPTNPRALRRTFGQSGPPKLKLYRDSAAWCPYCEKVWLQLEEKRIPYEIEKINMRCYGPKPKHYTDKVPSGLLPAMELNGRLITESDAIMAALEAEFPDFNPLLPPAGSPSAGRVRPLLRLERKLFGDWLRWLTSAWSNDANRQGFERTMDEVNAALSEQEGPYFLDDFSLVDCVFAPFLERIAASILYYKGLVVRGQGRWPAIDAWFDAMETRETYLGIKSDIYTHVFDLPPQIGGCVSLPEAEEVAAALDGSDGKSWHLPLYPLTTSSLECHAPGEVPERDTLQAASRLVGNHEAVVKFSLRGPGTPGQPPVSAPLADPNALAALEYHEAADAGLRHVAHALLLGVDEKQASSQPLRVSSSQPDDGPAYDTGAVQLAAGYLRDRVGVPRDLPLPAARQLRAHCNWLIDSMAAAS